MAQMTGADIGDLESGAARLESVGTRIGAMRRPLRSQLYSSHWEGRAAVRFRSEWDTVHGPALTNAESFLREAGQRLRAEADQQRHASNMGGGGHGPSNAGGTTAPLKESLLEIEELLKRLGVPISAVNDLLGRLALLDELGVLIGPLKSLAENDELIGAFKAMGSAIKYAELLIEFVTIVADNPQLPMDEAVVLAGATVAVGLAAGVGIKAASSAIGKAVGTAAAGAVSGGIAAPVGLVVGTLVGEVVGNVMTEAFDAADERFNITENVAQQTLEAYRFAKERDFNAGRIAFDGTRAVVNEVTDGAQNLLADAGSKLADARTDLLGDLRSLF